MPPLNSQTAKDLELLRTLIIGASQTRKTWWAGTAAEAGFRVHIASLDGNTKILQNISQAAQARINVIRIRDQGTNYIVPRFFQKFLTDKAPTEFVWDEEKNNITNKTNSASSRYLLDAQKLTRDDVFVLDNWTIFCRSLTMAVCQEMSIDPSELDNDGRLGREVYGKLATMHSWYLQRLHSLPCHVILLSHPQVYEKRKVTRLANGKTQEEVEWTREQPASVTGPQGMHIAKDFQDCLRFVLENGATVVHTSGDHSKDGGSRAFKPGKFLFDVGLTARDPFNYKKLADAYGQAPSELWETGESPGFKYFPAGVPILAQNKTQDVSSEVQKETPTVEAGNVNAARAAALKAALTKR